MNRVLITPEDIRRHTQFFQPEELASKDNGAIFIDQAALALLEVLRLNWGPIRILSAYRTPARNKAVGGAPNSYHMQGRAFDCAVSSENQLRFAMLADTVGFKGIILYPNKEFVHVDNRQNTFHGLTV